jgi:hypothetical protein
VMQQMGSLRPSRLDDSTARRKASATSSVA